MPSNWFKPLINVWYVHLLVSANDIECNFSNDARTPFVHSNNIFKYTILVNVVTKCSTMDLFHWQMLISSFYFRLQKKVMQTSEWHTNNRLHRKVSSIPHTILCRMYRSIRVIRTSFDQLALTYYLQICQWNRNWWKRDMN